MLIIKIKSVCNVRAKRHKLRKMLFTKIWHENFSADGNLNIDLWHPTYFSADAQGFRDDDFADSVRSKCELLFIFHKKNRNVFCIMNSGLKSISAEA